MATNNQKTTDDSILDKIAAQMKRMARERAASLLDEERERPVRHLFRNGAMVDIKFTHDSNGVLMWKMRVARDGVFPSDVEMKVFRRAFGVTPVFINDAPQQWLPHREAGTVRFAYVLRWHAREEQERMIEDAQ